ncbi:class gamma glutathione S-transferase [Hesseltinella vesiculosa]|uniref:Class gamma glutathione S-transferase n=1 Tax=Hesseltinella vesiculosa TaxID=101127 RepID=A0A1X2GNX9_9FUNG|nr:class gamma glutathione S-transferase [Hesseltinella vesiculosa]
MTLENTTLYYFNIPGVRSTTGNGEPLNLMLMDAGVSYKYDRVALSAWSETKQKLTEEKVCFQTLPVLELEGDKLSSGVPTMRHLARKLNAYGANADEKSWLFLDQVSDSFMDWRHAYDEVIWFSPTEMEENADKVKAYLEKTLPAKLAAFDRIYSFHNGPFVLGEEISYVDFLIYHGIDDGWGLDKVASYENLARLVQAMENRKALQAHLAAAKNEKIVC